MALLRTPTLRPWAIGSLLQAAATQAAPSAFASSSRLAIAPPTPSGSRGYAAQGYQVPANYSPKADEVGLSPVALRRKHLKEKHVLLSALPLTATPSDIRALARETKTANDVGRIEFVYTRSLRPSGKAIASFSSPAHAQRFEESANGRIMGGRMIRAHRYSLESCNNLLRHTYGNWPEAYQLPLDLIEYETGKLVLLSNIPHETYEARLEERLADRYDLRPQDRWRGKRSSYAAYNLNRKGYGGSHDEVLGGVLKLPRPHADATTTSFIVRCQTQTEAMRLVRRWHNTYFAPKTFDIQDTGGRYRVTASILY